MTHRTFRDRAGYEWAVWDVYPMVPERRALDRRQGLDRTSRLVERRTHADRRQQRLPRVLLGRDYSAGWLCFESTGVRRRLAPIPQDWTDWTDAQLEEGCRRATPVVRRAAG